MSSSPRRRIGRDGILLAVMLCVPLLVLLGFRVAAAPSAPPPVEERPIQLISDTSTPRPTSTSPSPTKTSPTTTSPSKKSTTKTSTKKAPSTTAPRTTQPQPAAPRTTWTPTRTPTWTSQTNAPSYGDDDDDDGDDDEWDDD